MFQAILRDCVDSGSRYGGSNRLGIVFGGSAAVDSIPFTRSLPVSCSVLAGVHGERTPRFKGTRVT